MSGLPKKSNHAIFAFILVVLCALNTYAAAVHPMLAGKVRLAGSNEYIPIIVRLSSESTAQKIFGSRAKSISSIKDSASSKREKLSSELERLSKSGHIKNTKSFGRWI